MCNNPWQICSDSLKMIRILGLKILRSSSKRVPVATSLFDNLGLGFQQPTFKFFSVLAGKASVRHLEDERKNCFTVSYLVNSCGIPLQTALNVASKVKFKTPKNPDSVLSLLQTQGFSKPQISYIVKQFPNLLFTKSDQILLPKFEYLHSLGLSKSECVQIIHSCPFLLGRSLKKHIVPSYKYLKSVLVEDEKVLKCLKRSPRAFLRNLQLNIVPNIALLRKCEVSEVWISFFVTSFPDSAFCKHSKFCSFVNQVKDMGFDPLKHVFVMAISVLSKMTPLTLERKFEAYRKCGWSKDQSLLAFKRFPQSFWLSEKNIFKTMDFFVHKMGMKPEDIATNPTVLCYSLEKRIIPRWSVVRSLYAKGLLKKELSIFSILRPTENIFLKRYVTKFPNDVTWLLQLYTGEIKAFDV